MFFYVGMVEVDDGGVLHAAVCTFLFGFERDPLCADLVFMLAGPLLVRLSVLFVAAPRIHLLAQAPFLWVLERHGGYKAFRQ